MNGLKNGEEILHTEGKVLESVKKPKLGETLPEMLNYIINFIKSFQPKTTIVNSPNLGRGLPEDELDICFNSFYLEVDDTYTGLLDLYEETGVLTETGSFEANLLNSYHRGGFAIDLVLETLESGSGVKLVLQVRPLNEAQYREKDDIKNKMQTLIREITAFFARKGFAVEVRSKEIDLGKITAGFNGKAKKVSDFGPEDDSEKELKIEKRFQISGFVQKMQIGLSPKFKLQTSSWQDMLTDEREIRAYVGAQQFPLEVFYSPDDQFRVVFIIKGKEGEVGDYCFKIVNLYEKGINLVMPKDRREKANELGQAMIEFMREKGIDVTVEIEI